MDRFLDVNHIQLHYLDYPGGDPPIKQPLLLLNALGSFGPPGAPPMLPRQKALETVNGVPQGTYVEVPGNHMTMLFGDSAQRAVEAIVKFVGTKSV
ncbi:MAG: hypothetical protein P8Y03_28630 [Anaerolineales bacterium]